MKNRIIGTAFIVLAIFIASVLGLVYESAQQTVNQTIVNVATLTLKDSALGNLEEGETKSYTKADVATLGRAISVTTTKGNVFLHLDSDIDSLSTYYTTYDVTVKYITVPGGSSHSVGDTAGTMTIAAPDPAAITLDVAGSWAFDFELTTTAKSVSSDQATAPIIVVTAEST